MRGATRDRPAGRQGGTGISAVVWIEQERALVARTVRGAGELRPEVTEVAIPRVTAALPSALADIAHLVAGADRVVIIGPDDLRTALEREIVAIGHRPEVIREAYPEQPANVDSLLARLERVD